MITGDRGITTTEERTGATTQRNLSRGGAVSTRCTLPRHRGPCRAGTRPVPRAAAGDGTDRSHPAAHGRNDGLSHDTGSPHLSGPGYVTDRQDEPSPDGGAGLATAVATEPTPPTPAAAAVDHVSDDPVDHVSDHPGNQPADTGDGPAAARRRPRRAVRLLLDVTAVLAVLVGLLAPDLLARTRPGDFLRIPVEGLLLVVVLLVLPRRAGRVFAVLAGIGLGMLNLVKLLDTGFHFAFTRPFDPIVDWSFFGDGLDFLSTSFGAGAMFGAVAAVVVLVPIGFAVAITSVLRISRIASRRRPLTAAVVAVLSALWVASAFTAVEVFPNRPIAARSAASLVHERWTQAQVSLQEQGTMSAEAAVDRFKDVPGDQLLTGLRGKNVVLVFVESYGRSALEDPRMARQVAPLLDAGTSRLAAAGFAARSGWLTSPTYGGGSWFAHSTLLSGLWVDTQGRYKQLTTATQRLTLNKAFRSAGWRTVGVEPAIRKAWPEGDFYGFDKLYDFGTLGYKGPRFGYAPMTDQFILSTFHRNELVDAKQPVMGELVLVSSHSPWAPLPVMVDWDEVGDGSVFGPMPARGQDRVAAWQNQNTVRSAYVQSVRYTLEMLLTYVQRYGDPNTVLVVLGDHQPGSVVTSNRFGRDVPISVIAHDPAVLDRIADWNWTPGLRPAARAPVWPMSDFRDRFLTAYGPQTSAPTASAPASSTSAAKPSATAVTLPADTPTARRQR